jgi:hypothetical protein
MWIIMAWQCISPQVTEGFYKVLYIQCSRTDDDDDDDTLCNGSEEDGNVRSECYEDEGTDHEDGDSDTDW